MMSNKPKINIGLFGGTFDPIHIAHLIIAEFVCEAARLERLFFIPARIHPFKNNRQIGDSRHRAAMVRLAIRNNPHFAISEAELDKEGVSYTIDTVKLFRGEFPPESHELLFLMGADNLAKFREWKQPEELARLCRILVFGRPHANPLAPEDPLSAAFQYVETPLLEISSTGIRERVQQGRSIRYLVPAPVEAYIHKHSLYR